jgi:hypothetical protein
MAATDIVSLPDVKAACGILDTDSDLWLGGVISAVSEAVEAVTGRWFAPRSSTWYFDAADDDDCLEVPMGVVSLSYLGVATTDQPDGGTGTYSAIPATAYYLDPPVQQRRNGAAAYRITLSETAGYQFPYLGQKRSIKATGIFGAPSPRISQIATAACIRAWRAKLSGQADYAIIGLDGGMKILRDFAPSELEELRNTFGAPVGAG